MTGAGVGAAVAAVRRLGARARAEGRAWLLEPEALEVAAALGIRPPAGFTVHGPAEVEADRLAALGSADVVVKGLAPGVVHKAARGWVRVVASEPGAVRAALPAMGDGPVAYLVQERVPHREGPAGELLVGVRATAEFGPVVSVGPGGSQVELLAGLAERSVVIFSAEEAGPEAVAAALADSPLVTPLTGELGGVVARLAEFAAAVVPDEVAEFEINPLAVTPQGPVALDAVLRVGASGPEPAPPRPLDKLVRLLEPRSIAIVGVSRDVNPGRLILRNVLRAGFPPDRVLVVKPGVAELDGCRCVADLADLPGVDLLVLSVAASQVPGLMDRVIALGCAEAVIVIPGGLGERAGTEAAAAGLGAAVAAARQRPDRGPLVVGGNCLGVRSRPGRYDTFFIPAHKLAPPPARSEPVALVSQSGALILSVLDRLAWLEPRYAISVGNQLDLTVGDFFEHLAGDDVAVAACYVEGFRPGDGSRFLAATRRLRRRGGAGILYRAGRSPAGAGAAASHTAAVAGDYAVTRALAEAAGVLVADTLADFADLLMLATLLRDRPVDGLGLGAVSNAGFETVAMADGLGPLTLADLDGATVARLEASLAAAGLEPLVAVRNPLDVTPAAGDEVFAAAAGAVLAAPAVSVGLVGCVPFTAALATLAAGPDHGEDVTAANSVAARLARLPTDKPWAAVVDGGAAYDPMAALLLARGIPTFRQADRAVRLLARYTTWRLSNSPPTKWGEGTAARAERRRG